MNLPLNKTTLARRRRELQAYAQVLPSLDLKRRQLAALLAAERRALVDDEASLEAAVQARAAELPMLGALDIEPTDRLPQRMAAALRSTRLEPTLGVPLPALDAPQWPAMDGETLAMPAWHESACAALQGLAETAERIGQRRRRLALLDAALRHTWRRVNLFERRLIPAAEADVRLIRNALADLERAAIVRAKRVRAQR